MATEKLLNGKISDLLDYLNSLPKHVRETGYVMVSDYTGNVKNASRAVLYVRGNFVWID